MNSKKILLNVFYWLLVIIMMLVIVRFSLEDGEKSSETSGGIVDVVVELLPNSENVTVEQKENIGSNIRQLGHFGIYLLLAFFSSNALRGLFDKIMPYPLLLAFAMSLEFALFDEFVVQANTNGRAAEWSDIVTDMLGAVCGILIYDLLLNILMNIIKLKKRRST